MLEKFHMSIIEVSPVPLPSLWLLSIYDDQWRESVRYTFYLPLFFSSFAHISELRPMCVSQLLVTSVCFLTKQNQWLAPLSASIIACHAPHSEQGTWYFQACVCIRLVLPTVLARSPPGASSKALDQKNICQSTHAQRSRSTLAWNEPKGETTICRQVLRD